MFKAKFLLVAVLLILATCSAKASNTEEQLKKKIKSHKITHKKGFIADLASSILGGDDESAEEASVASAVSAEPIAESEPVAQSEPVAAASTEEGVGDSCDVPGIGSGTCSLVSDCSGTATAGHCAGSSNVQCCTTDTAPAPDADSDSAPAPDTDSSEPVSTPSAAPTADTSGVPAPGVDLIKQFEGCHLDAYPDPLSGNLPITIGWGSTRKYDGSRFVLGESITQTEADNYLTDQLASSYLPPLSDIPDFSSWNDDMKGAILSFAYNLGANFYGARNFETISRRLRTKDYANIRSALVMYRNPGSNVEAGLRRRREAEADLFLKGFAAMGGEVPESSSSSSSSTSEPGVGTACDVPGIGSGTCSLVSDCSGTSTAGHCDGSSNVQCCTTDSAPAPDADTNTDDADTDSDSTASDGSIPDGVDTGGCTLGSAASARGCSTHVVSGLTAQIVAKMNQMGHSFTRLPDDQVKCSGACQPYLQTAAADALLAATTSANDYITLNAAYRSCAQQYLLYKWQGSCGISIAAKPGTSKHEMGAAIDTSNYNSWMSKLRANSFKWYGSGDRVHFTYTGSAPDVRRDNLKALQMLWNENNPNDTITADGRWGSQSEAKLKNAPCGGW